MNIFSISRAIMSVLLLSLAVQTHSQSPFAHGELRVDASGKYLEHSDHTPFLYLGDTAWEMLSRLNYEETCLYLDNRAEKGFTVIQTVIIPELESIGDSTASGHPIFSEDEPPFPHPDHLAHIDSILTYAEKKGLYLALLPTWGDKVDKQWGIGPELFNVDNAKAYGIMLGRRWASRQNIIWIIGGDRTGDDKNKEIWNALANGIRTADSHHLMSYHPNGEHSSSMWFHDEQWLDFNMIQTGHCQHSYSIYRSLMWPDQQRAPVKPVMDGEPRYEDICRDFNPEHERFTAIDVRHSLYQSMLTGACGYTYGNNNIWQMYAPGRKPECHAIRYWYDALDMDGACQLSHFVGLWQEFPFREGRTYMNGLKALDGYTADEAIALCASDWMICYFPGGSRWEIDLPSEWSGRFTLTWMDPQSGRCFAGGEGDSQENTVLTLPEKEGGRSATEGDACTEGLKKDNDWVLMIRKKQNNK